MGLNTHDDGTADGHLLVATDFSESARAALNWAVDIAAAHGTGLHLVHAVEAFDVPIHVPLETQELIDRSVGDHFADLEAVCADRGVLVTMEHRTGKPWRVIVEVEHRRRPDLVVIGARGTSAYAGMLLGSTADRVVRFARSPVLTVHTGDGGSPGGCRTILVATDFSEESALATTMALRIVPPGSEKRRLILLHVCHAPIIFESEAAAAAVCRQMQDDEEAAQRRLEALAAPLRRDDLDVQVIARPGDPVAAIEEEARAAGADLIAVGTHGRSGIGHMIMGSVAERIVHHASCPVLTVRRPDAPEPVRISEHDALGS